MSDRSLKGPGDPRELLAYKKAEIIYLLTFRFCERFLKQREEAFREGGGLRERLTNARLEVRRRQSGGLGRMRPGEDTQHHTETLSHTEAKKQKVGR